MSAEGTGTTAVDAYAAAGVDIAAGDEAVRRITGHVERTRRPEVVGGLGGFGAGFAFDPTGWREPVLVSATDGVGTKVELAARTGRWRTIGIDLVAMCVNDIATMGAEPLFFLDYLATGALDPAVVEDVVAGIADGCLEAGCALVGGETAEMPGLYAPGTLDLAGFVVGVVERSEQLSAHRVRPGDALIGIASSGLHSNGYSLVRHLLERHGLEFDAVPDGLGRSLADELLEPTKIYVRLLERVRADVELSAAAHITGGGLLENLPRVLPTGLGAVVHSGSWDVPPIFGLLAELGELTPRELHRTFNMGVGMVLVVAEAVVGEVLNAVTRSGGTAWRIGTVEAGVAGVQVEGAGS